MSSIGTSKYIYPLLYNATKTERNNEGKTLINAGYLESDRYQTLEKPDIPVQRELSRIVIVAQ